MGVVTDRVTGEPIMDAGVEAVEVRGVVRTDPDGKYALKLSAGTYELRVFAPFYRGARLKNVAVKAMQATKADFALSPEGKAAVEIMEVVAAADRSAEATQLVHRQKSAVISENVGAQTIRKSTDSDAAEVAERLPSVTVKENKFVFVRGLGERYSTALLHGSRLPSTDPDKRVVSLDLFPAEFIESLSVIKSYTPDLPGDFSGGLIQIVTKDFPERRSAGIGLSISADSKATFRDFETYEGDSLDYLGIGTGFRALPEIVRRRRIEGERMLSPSVQRELAGAFKNIWSVDATTAPPNFGVSFSVGDSIGPLGFSLGGLYGTDYDVRRGEIATALRSVDGLKEETSRDDFVYDRSTFTTRLGGVLTAAYKLSGQDKIGVRALVNRLSTDEVLRGEGYVAERRDEVTSQSRLGYREDQLGFGQLSGEHARGGLEIAWRYALSQTTRGEPDTRLFKYRRESGAPLASRRLLPDGESPLRTFLTLEELLHDAGADFTIPLPGRLPWTDPAGGLPAKLQLGAAYGFRDRELAYRRFNYSLRRPQDVDLAQRLEVLLRPHMIPSTFLIEEQTRRADSFNASQEIAAAYGMVDSQLVPERLRVVAGVRAEYSFIRVNGHDRQSQPALSRIRDIDPIPGVSLIYTPLQGMNVRYGFSRTISRPEFREMTPTQFVAPSGEYNVRGNPNLRSATIDSHDLRWEWFISHDEILAASLFYKSLSAPIEQTAQAETSQVALTFENAESATLLGGELEARRRLSALVPAAGTRSAPTWLTPALSRLALQANFSYVWSEANLGASPTTALLTSKTRPMVGQAPFVANASLEYADGDHGTVRLLYNTIGRQIAAAGRDALPDIYEERTEQVDLVYLKPVTLAGSPVNLKFSIENILDDAVERTIGDIVTTRYTTGVKFGLGLSASF